jgi:hypothetical protein
MKNPRYLLAISAISLALVFGCSYLEPPRFYIAGYKVKTDAAKSPQFRATIRQLAADVADELQYPVITWEDNRPGVLIAMQGTNLNVGPNPRVVFSWTNNKRDDFSVSVWKYRPEETEEIRRARAAVERVLKEHPDFMWKSELTHHTMAY